MSVSRRYKIYGAEGDIAQCVAVEHVLRVAFDTDVQYFRQTLGTKESRSLQFIN
jgi:hypothetical protein